MRLHSPPWGLVLAWVFCACLLVITTAFCGERPGWIQQLPHSSEELYFSGDAIDIDRETARTLAHARAVLWAGKTVFPELVKVAEKTVLSINDSEYSHVMEAALQDVQFRGLEEDSLYIEEKDGRTHVFVLLKWKRADIEKERVRLEVRERNVPLVQLEGRGCGLDKNRPTGELEVITEPPGAVVFLDGEVLGTSHLLARKICEGSHAVHAALDGYLPGEDSAVVVSASETKRVKLVLARAKGLVSVVSNPSGASVFVDSLPKGKTPVSLETDVGSHSIRIARTDYFDELRDLSVTQSAQKLEVDLRLKPGKLTVLANVKDARVILDGNILSENTPLLAAQVPGGNATLVVRKDGFQDYWQQISVRESQNTVVNAQLVPFLKYKYEPQNASQSYRAAHPSSYATARRIAFWSSVPIAAAGMGVLAYSFVVRDEANKAHRNYTLAKTSTDAVRERERTVQLDRKVTLLQHVGGALASLGWVTFVYTF